ncbi:hypothetical protein [Roseateles asaccharophilus]|uniref:Uncharacterized protein n=1 Tax=Roseateles asaccharophilus TaxID=582607 RepID=A0ABU2ABM9_9BURK|nr:hypothetical protein [Roseateles asaccharophilus]MDR7334601.1 hypothetical protein [Roseateles asaccharophilus]
MASQSDDAQISSMSELPAKDGSGSGLCYMKRMARPKPVKEEKKEQ